MQTPTTQNSATATTSATAARFSAQEFLKMFAAAVGAGVAVSVVATAVALLLSRDVAAASTLSAHSAAIEQPYAAEVDPFGTEASPGDLFIGGGCDREAVEVIERDWQIRVDGSTAEIRVMQSFLMPIDGPTVAFFEAVLPKGATFKSLKSHGAGPSREAKLASATAQINARANVEKVDTVNQLVMWHDVESNIIQTAQIPNMKPGEPVTIEYTYTVRIDANHSERVLDLALAPAVQDSYDANDTKRPATIPASVWVEWVGAKPKHLRGLSGDFALETAADGVIGLSWFSAATTAGHKLNVAWDAVGTPATTAVAKR
jgi:hypothetical protein